VPLGETGREHRVDVPSERDIDGRRRPSGMRAPAAVEPVIACTRGDADRAKSGRERDTVSEQLDVRAWRPRSASWDAPCQPPVLAHAKRTRKTRSVCSPVLRTPYRK
jgi:hypothetical protein